jgi:hypothetical protein
MRPTRWSLLAECGVLAVAAAMPVILERARGLAHAAGDLWTLFIPNYAWWFSRPRWLGGWNPWIFGGYPANADPQIGQLHPFGLLYAVLPPLDAAALEGMLSPATAAIGMLLYLRRLGCGRAARLVGALAFGLGGFVAAQAPHPAHVRAAIAVPWALLALESLDGLALTSGLGAATAAIVVAGHPQLVVYALAVVLAYAVILGRLRAPGRARAVAAGLLFGLAVGAGMWLPTLELIGHSTLGRSADALAPVAAEPVRLVGRHLAALVVPFAGGGGAGPLWGRSQDSLIGCSVVECAGYPGTLAWLALLAGAPALLRTGHGRFWLALGGLGLVLATGAFGVMPPLAGVRAPARLVVWWSLAAAVGAALALTHGAGRPAAWWVAVGILAAVIGFTATRGAVAGRAALGAVGVLAAAGAALVVHARRPRTGALLVAVAAADLIAFRASLPVGVPPERLDGALALLSTVREAVAHNDGIDERVARGLVVPFASASNWASHARLPLVQGYNALVPAPLAALLGHDPSTRAIEVGWVMDPSLAAPTSHVLDLLRCRTVAALAWGDGPFASALAGGGDRWHRLDGAARDVALYANPRARPVAWLVHRARVRAPAEALAVVRGTAGPFDPATEVLVERAVEGIPETGTRAASPVKLVDYGEDEIRLATDAGAPGIVVTSELAYPGWTATVDGEATELLTVNAAFRGLLVPAGHHEIVLAYRPRTTRIGLGLSLLATVALAVAAARRRAPSVG